jgi:Tfp pilus assembly protein PilE
MSANFQPFSSRKGLAIASLVLGIISIPTLGLFAVGGITGIILGAVALSKIKNNPQAYGGRSLAIAGIITSAVSLTMIFVFGLLDAIVLPQLQHVLYRGRETATFNSLQTIHAEQAQYKATNGRFATLRELAEASLIDKRYLDQEIVSSYVYTDSDVSEKTYCVHGTRASNSAATTDFVVCEDGIIRYIESKTKGIVKRGEGKRLFGDDSAAP